MFPFTFNFTVDTAETSSPANVQCMPNINAHSLKRKTQVSLMGSPNGSPFEKKAHTFSAIPENNLQLIVDNERGRTDNLDVIGSLPNKHSSDKKKMGAFRSFFTTFDNRKDYEKYLREDMVKYKEEKGNHREVLHERQENERAKRQKLIREGNAERQRNKRKRDREEREILLKKARIQVH